MSRFRVGLRTLSVSLLAGCSSLPATETGELDHRHIVKLKEIKGARP